MTDRNQNLEVFRDDEIITTTVKDQAGVAIDISTVSTIVYSVYDRTKTLVFSRTKAAGEIAFVTTGVDGNIRIGIADTNLTSLIGWYAHHLTMTDASGNLSTLFTGMLTVSDRNRGD